MRSTLSQVQRQNGDDDEWDLEADTEAEGKGDKHDDPGEGGEQPAAQTDPVFTIVCWMDQMMMVMRIVINLFVKYI